MTVCSLISTGGGSGRSTLCAQLASVLARRGREVLALDLDPGGTLGLQLGLPLSETDGWAARAAAGADWRDAAFRNSDGVSLLPFGELAADALGAFEDRLSRDPSWLRRQIEQLAFSPNALVLIDTPRLPSPLARQAIEASGLLLNVMRADTAAYCSLPRVHAVAAGRPLLHVLNQVEAMRPLQADLLQLMRRELGEQLSPGPVHRDEAVAESVAANLALSDHAPHSQATHDLQGLASWLLKRLPDTAA